jgi:hypothetical protein
VHAGRRKLELAGLLEKHVEHEAALIVVARLRSRDRQRRVKHPFRRLPLAEAQPPDANPLEIDQERRLRPLSIASFKCDEAKMMMSQSQMVAMLDSAETLASS